MTTPVTAKATRPGGPPGRCFYCGEAIGATHKPDCILLKRRVVVEMAVQYVVDVPESWDEHDIEFHRNESSWCAGNDFEMLARVKDADGGRVCGCSAATFRFVREATEDDVELLPCEPSEDSA